MIFVGLDPGRKGAIAILDEHNFVSVHDMPLAEIEFGKKERCRMFTEGVIEILEPYLEQPLHVLIEKQWSWGEADKMSPTAQFQYADSYGDLKGYFRGRGIATSLVAPKTWQDKVVAIGGKDGHLIRALQLFPKLPPSTLKGSRGALKDGRADALLIAYHGYLTLGKR